MNDVYIETAVGDLRVGFPLRDIDHAIRAVAVRAVPAAPGCLMGTIDVAGEPVALFDAHRMLGLPGQPVRASDRFLLARADARCAFRVDEVIGTLVPQSIAHADSVGLRALGLRGVAADERGTLLLQDLRNVLALERAAAFALSEHG